jgi:hypothetical protein
MATKGAKRKPKLTDKAQSERFKQTARKLQANESAEDFEVKFKKIVPAKRPDTKNARA